ncbi:MAG: hypothetical protein AAF804_17915, partial [Bacteroidota bacterium]
PVKDLEKGTYDYDRGRSTVDEVHGYFARTGLQKTLAGGKLSPRQKMINMMYLVLLALLAMNVSKEILDSFEILKAKLYSSATAAQSNTSDFMESMKTEIREEIENQGKLDNKGLLDTLDMIKATSLELVEMLNVHIDSMTSIAGEDPVTGELQKKDELEANYQYWMGENDLANKGRGNGKAFELRNQIDGYSAFITDIYNGNANEENQIELKKLQDKQEADGENKTWEKYTFDAPVIANMAMLEALKVDVFEKEKELLDLLNQRLGVAAFKADKVIAINAPTATIVPAGLQFQTKLFVAMSSDQIQPRFSGSGRIEKEGSVATMTVPASGRVIPKGKAEGTQSYSASIQVPKATGGYENLEVKGSFTVRRPEIVVTSEAIQILYQNCGNDVRIDVPALGDQYNPKVALKGGGDVRQSPKDKKVFRIVPTGRSAVVQVNTLTNGQNLNIGDVAYKVIRPPKPTIDIFVGGRPYDGAGFVPKRGAIGVKINPNSDFASALPQDARYAVSGATVLAQLSLGPPKT